MPLRNATTKRTRRASNTATPILSKEGSAAGIECMSALRARNGKRTPTASPGVTMCVETIDDSAIAIITRHVFISEQHEWFLEANQALPGHELRHDKLLRLQLQGNELALQITKVESGQG